MDEARSKRTNGRPRSRTSHLGELRARGVVLLLSAVIGVTAFAFVPSERTDLPEVWTEHRKMSGGFLAPGIELQPMTRDVSARIEYAYLAQVEGRPQQRVSSRDDLRALFGGINDYWDAIHYVFTSRRLDSAYSRRWGEPVAYDIADQIGVEDLAGLPEVRRLTGDRWMVTYIALFRDGEKVFGEILRDIVDPKGNVSSLEPRSLTPEQNRLLLGAALGLVCLRNSWSHSAGR